jgi:hypothetical protein
MPTESMSGTTLTAPEMFSDPLQLVGPESEYSVFQSAMGANEHPNTSCTQPLSHEDGLSGGLDVPSVVKQTSGPSW